MIMQTFNVDQEQADNLLVFCTTSNFARMALCKDDGDDDDDNNSNK